MAQSSLRSRKKRTRARGSSPATGLRRVTTNLTTTLTLHHHAKTFGTKTISNMLRRLIFVWGSASFTSLSRDFGTPMRSMTTSKALTRCHFETTVQSRPGSVMFRAWKRWSRTEDRRGRQEVVCEYMWMFVEKEMNGSLHIHRARICGFMKELMHRSALSGVTAVQMMTGMLNEIRD